jgi:hypothetical protein
MTAFPFSAAIGLSIPPDIASPQSVAQFISVFARRSLRAMGSSMSPGIHITVLVLVWLASGTLAFGQAPTTIRVEVRSDAVPVADAEVIVNGTTYETATDGIVSIPVSPGTVEITVLKGPLRQSRRR